MNFAKFNQSLKMSISSIMSNKARSALTMLGIIIGVASVIILTGIGGGATKEITDSLSEMGTGRITVSMTRGRNSSRTIDVDEITKYVTENPDKVSTMSPYLTSSVTVKNGRNNISTTLDGFSAQYETIGNLELQSGRFFTESEIAGRKKVCIIGTYQMSALYGGADPVGEDIKINGTVFEIIGVYKESESSKERSADDKISIPYTTAMRFLRTKNIQTFYLYAADESKVQEVTDHIERYITKVLGTNEGFRVSNMTSLMDTLNEATGIMTTMLAGIAGISLVVGGIGIMNIMTVSVSERTREIGIRKAIGAKTTDILLQFLIESIVLSGTGGVIGILFGSLVGIIINLTDVLTYATQQNMVILSFVFSLAVGVFFGLNPAKKAAKLNPIDALRSE